MVRTPALFHPRWSAFILFWAVSLLALFLLLAPPDAENQSRALFTLGTWVLAAAWWFTANQARQQEIFALGPAVLALVVALALATLWSQDTATSLNPFTHELANLLFFLTALAAARSLRGVRQALAWLVALAAVFALYGIYQVLGGLDASSQIFFGGRLPQGLLEQQIAQRLNARRAFAWFVYPNLLAGFLAMLLPVAVSLAALATGHMRRWAWSLVAALMLTGLFATASVGGWLCAGMGLGLLFWLAGTPVRAPKTRWLLAAAGLILLAAAGYLIIQQRGLGAVLGDAQDRLANWRSAAQMALAYPLTGAGPGFFGTLFPEFQSAQGYYVRFAHNFILNQAAETGLAGLLAWLGFIGVAIGMLAARFRELKPGRKRLLVSGLAGGVAAGFLHACLDVDFHFLKTTLVFWLLLGTLFGLLGRLYKAGPDHPEANARPITEDDSLIRICLFAILALALWGGGRSPAVAGFLYGLCGLTLVLFLLAQTRTLTSWREWFQKLPLRWPLGLLFIWGILSAMVSPHPSAAIPGMIWAAMGLLLYVLMVRTPGMGPWVLLLTAAGATAMALLGLPRALVQPLTRLAAGWPNANLAAAFFSMGVLAQAVIAGFVVTKPWQRGAAAGGALVCFAALLATGSFGGLLNLAAGFLAILLGIWRGARARLAWYGLAVLLLAMLAVILPLNLRQRWQQVPAYQGQAYERMHIAWSALQMAKDRPLTGWGPGNFAAAFEGYNFPNVRGLARYGKWAEFAHNEPLQMLAVTGVPGLLLLLWLAWRVLLAGRAQWLALDPRSFGQAETAVKLTAWACLAGAAAQALVDFNWHLPALWLLGVSWLAIALSPSQPRLLPRQPRLVAPAAWFSRLDALSLRLPAVVLLLLTTAAVTAACRPLYSEYLQRLGGAQQLEKNLKGAAREYQRSLVVHPLAPAVYDRLGQIQTEFYAAMGTDHWFQLAEWAFSKALRLNRLDAFIFRHLGQLYAVKAARLQGWERQQQLDRAIWQYRLALEKAPHQAFLMFELGNLQREAGYLLEAEQAWKSAIALEPCYAAAWSNLGVAQELRGDAKAAETSYRRALSLWRLAPEAKGKYELELVSLNWTVARFNLAHLLETQQRWAEAREEYTLILRQEPGNPNARRRLEMLGKY